MIMVSCSFLSDISDWNTHLYSVRVLQWERSLFSLATDSQICQKNFFFNPLQQSKETMKKKKKPAQKDAETYAPAPAPHQLLI